MSPRYGSRLLPVVVDEIAQSQPDLPYASVPLTANLSDGFKDITFSDITSATNYLAAWIHGNLGRSSDFDTIAYIGPGDLRYVVVFLAAIKCGYKVLLPSLRNSPWMNASLLEQTQCYHLLYAPEVEALVNPLLDQKADLKTHQVQALEDLTLPEAEHFPFDRDYDAAKWDPILILHSSGSTGPPRPIQMNHATFAVGDNDRNLPTVPGRVNQNWALWDFAEKETFFSPFPAFHLAGFSSMVMLPIYYSNATLVLGPPTRPPTGHLVSEIMDHFKLKSIFCPPIIAEQLVQEPNGLEKCNHLKFLLYAGGPLSLAAGDALSKVTDVCQFYGQTETGAIQALVPKREDWASLEWHPMQEAIMEPSVDSTYEMIMNRNPALEGVRNVSCNFPDVKVWRTKDLFKPHPTKPNLWTFHGRTDDIIVLSNGEKFNPVPSETQIAAHPLLAGALIIGQGHPQASLILEPKDHSRELKSLIKEIWPIIEKVNAGTPGHARITRDMILIGSSSKPFDRAAKGTVIRSSTGKNYEKETAELYARDVSNNLLHINLKSWPDLTETTQFVKEVIASVFPNHSVAEGDDLFVLGLDSLRTTEVVSLLKAGIKFGSKDKDVSWMSVKFVYENPSITTLAHSILSHAYPPLYAFAPGGYTTQNRIGKMESRIEKSVDTTQNRIGKMESMIEKYTRDLPQPQKRESSQQAGLHVLLTGSTGSLGTQLLVNLLSDPTVIRIHCLDRSATAQERITYALSTWSPPPTVDFSRVSFHQADYGKFDFGLPSSIFSELHCAVKVIIHSAWKVDFNHSLDSFEAVHIRGVRNLIDFSATSKVHPRIIFISSISSVGNWRAAVSKEGSSTPTIIPETLPPTLAVAQPLGYAESKAVAEQILASATEKSRISALIIRVGQIAGPVSDMNGARWNEHEWLHLLLKTSKALGKIPNGEALENIDWIPVDVLASVIYDLLKNTDATTSVFRVFHLVNPVVKLWVELLPVIQARFGSLEAVSMHEWVGELEKVNLEDRDAVALKPAVKILDFFREIRETRYIGAKKIIFSTEEAQRSSQTLRGLGPVSEDWMEKWLSDWGF
ncbi:acetyl-CoA synthetase-like protein [Zopfia rhizophila CBS 207.26]|uniref:Acetyl-CoA synthetase-like protein n=1 Tax=Zopfia rhizophila CBS 207.26 TaxID=1314779 RepID=A0A6A6DAH5_9PEZI|nr:acetyl-CoA synthetase-like protein [Zopfia rhizophila CBS 207.26]